MNLGPFRDAWLTTRPTYDRLCDSVIATLTHIVRDLGINASVSGRTKDMASFLKKCVLKGYVDPIAQMPDKLGCRVTFLFPGDLAPVGDALNEHYQVLKREEKGRDDEGLFGYAAIHYDLKTRADGTDLGGLAFELQLHTAGQHLWADATHKLAYKGALKPSREVARRLNRLSALLELFDQEIMETRKTLLGDPEHRSAWVLSELEKHYYRFTGRTFNPELSNLTMPALLPLLEAFPGQTLATELDAYVASKRGHLEQIFSEYAEDARCSPFLFQPEALAVFFLLDRDRFSLREAWCKDLPCEWLAEMGTIWGRPLEDTN